jgi:hypothetical protein
LLLLLVTPSGYPQQLHTQHFAGVPKNKNPLDSSRVILQATCMSTSIYLHHAYFLFQNSFTARLK